MAGLWQPLPEEVTLLATRVLVMSPRPGRVIEDHAIDFTRRSVTAAELRADPAFVAFAARLRDSIGSREGRPELLADLTSK